MKFIKPNFYDAFHCTAAACSDTCCAGWEIDVDPDTVEYYENLEGELGDRLREELCDLPDGTVCFRLGENERCPFLRVLFRFYQENFNLRIIHRSSFLSCVFLL